MFPKVLPTSTSVQMGIKATGFPVQIGENIDAPTNSQYQPHRQDGHYYNNPKFISINRWVQPNSLLVWNVRLTMGCNSRLPISALYHQDGKVFAASPLQMGHGHQIAVRTVRVHTNACESTHPLMKHHRKLPKTYNPKELLKMLLPIVFRYGASRLKR